MMDDHISELSRISESLAKNGHIKPFSCENYSELVRKEYADKEVKFTSYGGEEHVFAITVLCQDGNVILQLRHPHACRDVFLHHFLRDLDRHDPRGKWAVQTISK